jgi:ribosomal protein L22
VRNIFEVAQKARLVVDMIRGKDVNRRGYFALRKQAGGWVSKSACAQQRNRRAAEKANVSIDPDDLWVNCFVDRGPSRMERVSSGATGSRLSRAAPLLSRDDPAFE